MALGGGTFLTQNKVLPGVYVNFVSTASASASLSDRGIATIALAMDWGEQGKVFTVERAAFLKDSQKIFGYAYTADALKPMRELFRHAKTVHFFRLNQQGAKAENQFASAKYPGTRGNALRVVIETSENSKNRETSYDVSTYLESRRVDLQKGVSQISQLKDNDFLTWKSDVPLELTASTPLTGGRDGTVEDAAYQAYLDQAEAYSFNAMGCMSSKKTITDLFVSFCKRMREEVGKKFQVVVFRNLADYEGVVSVKNSVLAPPQESAAIGQAKVGQAKLSEETGDSPALIPWVTGVIAGMAVNRSATNLSYDGEYVVDTAYTHKELEEGILEGSFMLHAVGDKTAVLEDVNTFVSVTDEKSADFSSNQTMRVLDQIANDIAVLFAKKYLGKIPNDASGRISLWNDIVKHHQALQGIRAIEGFSSAHVTVERTDIKKAVVVSDHVTPVNAMAQLYMTVYVA